MRKIKSVIRLLFLVLFLFLMVQGKPILWFGIYGFSLLLALFFGRIYCGYMCPMNTVMEPAEWISKKLKIGTEKMPILIKSERFTWISLVVSVGIMIFAKKILKKNIPILLIWLLIAFLVTLRYKPEFLHNFLCPFAPLQKLFARKARYTEKVDQSKCIGCKLCQKVCPAGAIEITENRLAEIDSSYCHQCKICERECPKNCISYQKR